jgi:acyl-CoA thioesterase FadM
MYTARLDIRYRQNVPVGQRLRLVGKVGKTKGRTATSTGQIIGSDGSILAEAEALLVNVPEEVVDAANLEALGWKIYPEEDFVR